MEHRRNFGNKSLPFFILCCLIFLSFSRSAEAYKNYTVGDSLGWFDNLQKPTVNYQKWVSGKNFSLGDFLIFNTDNNHSVIQTYNVTTYKLCDYDDAEEDDTVQWSSADPSSTTPRPVSVPVPLLKVGMTYFFSSDYDGEQCQHGQHFKINVTYGKGLPETLKNPVESPAPTSPNSDDDSTPDPDTVISSNFNNPKESGDEKHSSGSVSLQVFMRGMEMKLNGVLLLFGLVWSFC